MSFLPCSSNVNVKYRGSSKLQSADRDPPDSNSTASTEPNNASGEFDGETVSDRNRMSKQENRKLWSSSSSTESSDEMNMCRSSGGGHSQNSTSRRYCINSLIDIAIRIILFVIFIQLERSPAFKRKIHQEELWLYKNPPTPDIVPASILLPAAFVVPFIFTLIHYLFTGDRHDFYQANNVITLALGLNGVLTGMLKLSVGRPRPDFYYRCFPNGVMNEEMECTGVEKVVNEGRKSFPSGHSSFAFTGLGFISFYMASKLHVFNERGRGQTWRFCLAILPLIIALLIAVSRTCDYHHHWQDVMVGSLIGLSVTYLCYRQYYPSITSSNCHKPLTKSKRVVSANGSSTFVTLPGPSNSNNRMMDEVKEKQPLIGDTKDNKWI